MSTQEQRERFESWVKKDIPALEMTWLPRMNAYAQAQPEWLWATWKAAEASMNERCAAHADIAGFPDLAYDFRALLKSDGREG